MTYSNTCYCGCISRYYTFPVCTTPQARKQCSQEAGENTRIPRLQANKIKRCTEIMLRGTRIYLDGSSVTLQPDDLPDKLLVPYSHELVHSSTGHALRDNHCPSSKARHAGGRMGVQGMGSTLTRRTASALVWGAPSMRVQEVHLSVWATL